MEQVCRSSLCSVFLAGAIVTATSVASAMPAGSRVSTLQKDPSNCFTLGSTAEGNEQGFVDPEFHASSRRASAEFAAVPSPGMAGLGAMAGLLAARRPRRVD